MTTHDDPERRSPAYPWFRVEVSDRDGQIVAIETEMLAGRDIGDTERETIMRAIRQLSGFLGLPASERDAVLAPIEPSEAMIEAAMPKAFIGHPEASEASKERWFASHRRALIEQYKAMIAAAPKSRGRDER